MKTYFVACSFVVVLGCESTPDTRADASTLLDADDVDSSFADSSFPDGSPIDGEPSDAFTSVDAGDDLLVLEFLTAFFDGVCSWFTRCEPKLGVVAFGQTLCHPLQRDEAIADFVELASSEGAMFDAAIAERCLAEVLAAECNVAAMDLARCDAAFRPQRELGESCVRDLECQNGHCVFGAECPGTCVARAGDRESCGRRSDCQDGLACIDGQCATPRADRDICTRRGDCEFPLTCLVSGVCGPPPGVGEPCAATFGGDLCAGDFVCSDGRCVAGAATGEACSAVSCAPGGRCTDGVCVATAVQGESCVAGGCIALHVCDDVCRPLPVVGDSCSTARPCVQGACVDGACTWLDEGETCDSADPPQFGECRGYCSRDVCQRPQLAGEACRGSSQCEEGTQCREVTGGTGCAAICT